MYIYAVETRQTVTHVSQGDDLLSCGCLLSRALILWRAGLVSGILLISFSSSSSSSSSGSDSSRLVDVLRLSVTDGSGSGNHHLESWGFLVPWVSLTSPLVVAIRDQGNKGDRAENLRCPEKRACTRRGGDFGRDYQSPQKRWRSWNC